MTTSIWNVQITKNFKNIRVCTYLENICHKLSIQTSFEPNRVQKDQKARSQRYGKSYKTHKDQGSRILFELGFLVAPTKLVQKKQQTLGHLEKAISRSQLHPTLFLDELDHIIWIPIYDRIVVPFLRRITGKESGFTILRRMGIGIFLSVITMIVSDLVDER